MDMVDILDHPVTAIIIGIITGVPGYLSQKPIWDHIGSWAGIAVVFLIAGINTTTSFNVPDSEKYYPRTSCRVIPDMSEPDGSREECEEVPDYTRPRENESPSLIASVGGWFVGTIVDLIIVGIAFFLSIGFGKMLQGFGIVRRPPT